MGKSHNIWTKGHCSGYIWKIDHVGTDQGAITLEVKRPVGGYYSNLGEREFGLHVNGGSRDREK